MIKPALQSSIFFTKTTLMHSFGHELYAYCSAYVYSAFHPMWDSAMKLSNKWRLVNVCL